MEKAAAFDVDFEGWELLPDQGMLSIYGKGEGRRSAALPLDAAAVTPKGAVQIDCFPDQSHLLVESIDDLSKAKQQGSLEPGGTNWEAGADVEKMYPDEKIVTEVTPPPLLPPAEEIPVTPTSPKKFLLDGREGENSDEEKRGEKEEEEKEENPVKDDGCVADVKSLSICDDNDKGKGWLDGFGFSIWRWRLTGIGALCSIGVAAATICIFILGGRQRHKQHQAEKLQFQIYADDKNLNQIVQHASRLNQAVSASRGAPQVTRANISFGGYYDGV